MQTETRSLYYDQDLQLEACYFRGIVQRFPVHFHEEYVIGTLESGKRYALCAGRTQLLRRGDLVLFNPRDPHACEQYEGEPLHWRYLSIPAAVMKRAVEEVTGQPGLPYFRPNFFLQSESAGALRELHRMICREERGLRKEESFLFLIGQLLEECADAFSPPEPPASAGVETVRRYLAQNGGKPVSLAELSAMAGLSKYHLLRSFTRQVGLSPYRYLETVRIDRAKRLLAQGMRPLDAALETGFSDQSHFSNSFKSMTGLTPRQYGSIFDRPTLEEEPSHGA